jgi:hypothetical protein
MSDNTPDSIPMVDALTATISHFTAESSYLLDERGPRAAAEAVLRLLEPVFAALPDGALKLAEAAVDDDDLFEVWDFKL